MLIPPQAALDMGKDMGKQGARQSRIDDLQTLADGLPDEALQSLHEFAAFLAQKYPAINAPVLDIQAIERPAEESVIKAIKRLSKTYPMLDKSVLFEQTSTAMSAHILQEVSAKESIDRLETVFRREYDAFINKKESKTSA